MKDKGKAQGDGLTAFMSPWPKNCMQKKPTKNKPERQGKTPTGPIAPVITSFLTEPKNPVAGVPFKMIIKGGDFRDNPDCIILPKKLFRQDLPPLRELCKWDNKMIYESCYLLEQTPNRIVWQGTLKEPGTYNVRAGTGVKGWPIGYSEAIELKIGFAPSIPGQGDSDVQTSRRQKKASVTVTIDGSDIDLSLYETHCLWALKKIVKGKGEHIRPVYITMEVWPGRSTEAMPRLKFHWGNLRKKLREGIDLPGFQHIPSRYIGHCLGTKDTPFNFKTGWLNSIKFPRDYSPPLRVRANRQHIP